MPTISRPETDGELLKAFVASHDETAFAVVVDRHAAMVVSVCRRLLDRQEDAEDAAQAVFITLARKAHALARNACVGAWLHHVARCVSINARKSESARVNRERKAIEMTPNPTSQAPDQGCGPGQDSIVIRELDALSEKYRQVLILFHIEGLSVQEVAHATGCTVTNVTVRLTRARSQLRARLQRRGVTVAASAAGALLAASADAGLVPTGFVAATTKAASAFVAGTAGTAVGVVSAKVVALTEGAMRTLMMTQMKAAAAAMVAVTVLGVGGTMGLRQALAQTAPGEVTPKTTAVVASKADGAALARRLEGIVLPQWKIKEEPLSKAVVKLAEAIKAKDPQQAAVAIELDPPTPSLRLQIFTLLTMDSQGHPTTAKQILEAMGEMTGQRVTFEKNRVVLSPLHPDKTLVTVPEVAFKETPLRDAIKSLQTTTGASIKLQRAGEFPAITLSGKGMKLETVVMNLANLAGLAMGYDQDGFILK